METVELSTLARQVTLGDFYDYASDEIAHLDPTFSGSLKRIIVDLSHLDGSMKTEVSYDMQHQEESRWSHLKLNTHLKASILANSSPEKLWFAPYLFNNDCQQELAARLAVHLRAVKRMERLEEELAAWLVMGARNSSKQSLLSATHIVQQITYGLNVIIVFELPVSSASEKRDMEGRLFLQAKKVFDRVADGFCSSADSVGPQDIPALESASWRVYSDVGFVNTPETGGFSDRLKRLQQVLRRTDCSCIPVEMVLFPIGAVAPNGLRVRDLSSDALDQLSMLKTDLFQVSARCQQLLRDPFLTRIPHFSPRLADFRNLLAALSSKISSAVSQAVVNSRRGCDGTSMDQVDRLWKTFFAHGSLLEHVIAREQELAVMKSLLEGIDLPFKAMDQLEAEYSGGAGLNVEIFIFKTIQVQDPVMLCWKRELNIPEGLASWTAFEIATAGNRHEVLSLRDRLLAFQETTKGSLCFLSTSDARPDGFLVTWKCQLERISRSPSSQPIVKWAPPEPLRYETSLRPQANVFLPRTQSNWSENIIVPDYHQPPPSMLAEEEEPKKTSDGTSAQWEESIEDERVEVCTVNAYREIYSQKKIKDQDQQDIRLAEQFVSLSQPLKEGHPSVYLLRCDEKSSPDGRLRWMEMGKPSEVSWMEKPPHQVVILLGPSGSGKSTLVNGMVNYILGVEWSDPYRFCISEKDRQMGGVTAYTIHHVQGMKIDYGMTIIDTPGFGDEEETARIIGRFLTHPQTQLDHVNAVFYVSSSCDPRPLPVQQDTLESAVSLLGRDAANCLRLLVTFSDGMKPSDLEAIRTADIPGLYDQADGMGLQQHQDFDNSSLYAPNEPLVDGGDNSVDRVSWNLGRANFESLFGMLGRMPAQSLHQTRVVLESKRSLRRIVKDMEAQLDVSCEKIEVIGQLQQLVVQFETGMEANKDFEVEDVHWITIKTQCNWMAPSAYNCTVCRQTCSKQDQASGCVKTIRKPGHCPTCGCPASSHRDENFRWRPRQERVKTVIPEKKAEYLQFVQRKAAAQAVMEQRQEELAASKCKCLELLDGMAARLSSIESSALRFRKTCPAEQLLQLKARAEREKRPGYLTRIMILDELLNVLAARSASASVASGVSFNNNYLDAGRGLVPILKREAVPAAEYDPSTFMASWRPF